MELRAETIAEMIENGQAVSEEDLRVLAQAYLCCVEDHAHAVSIFEEMRILVEQAIGSN